MKCWWCYGDLIEKDGKPIYKVYEDPVGNKHKVHKSCHKSCVQESKPVTAQAVGEICPVSHVIYRPTRIPDED